jgi:hypothetical protein
MSPIGGQELITIGKLGGLPPTYPRYEVGGERDDRGAGGDTAVAAHEVLFDPLPEFSDDAYISDVEAGGVPAVHGIDGRLIGKLVDGGGSVHQELRRENGLTNG